MAAADAGELQKELVCAICLDFFQDPVILKCGHNFCRDCILMHWEENGSDEFGYRCPECRQLFWEISLTKNYLVKNLVDKLDELDFLRSRPAKPAKQVPEGTCEKHHEDLKLFCTTDNKPICVICRESRAHRYHDVAPIPEVIEDMKTELRQRLVKLKWHRSLCSRVKTEEDDARTQIKMKKEHLRDRIEIEVGELVQFLLDEKDELLGNLEAEEQSVVHAIENNIKNVEKELTSVEKAITDLENLLKNKSSFEEISRTISSPFQINSSVSNSPCDPEWDEFTGPLQVIFWKKMLNMLRPGPENLILDLDTAHPNLIISDFCTTVEEGRGRVLEPDLPQKFTRFFGVLSTTQYSAGRHYWEVDVRDKGVWYLGITDLDSNRKGFVNLCPSAGYWSLCLQDRLYANEEDRVLIDEGWSSPRVGIYIDYEKGLVTFYNATNMKRLYTFDAYFDGPVCPFFSPGKNDPGSRLQICHYY
ncbi:E3 ubiquitin-protein ligase TRIM47 [Amia ocellicauda]|uniref:E3 ubiquitin-protein ligase TRIM47 n=1 Tax=Amia ocellicauda TaxID=2972642 RepID=UPI0034649750